MYIVASTNYKYKWSNNGVFKNINKQVNKQKLYCMITSKCIGNNQVPHYVLCAIPNMLAYDIINIMCRRNVPEEIITK